MLLILLGVAMAMLWSGHAWARGTRLRRWLVEAPAAWLSRRRLWQVGALVAAAVTIIVAVQVFGAEGEALRLVGSSVAEGAGWFVAFDVGVYIEAYALLLMLGATRQAKAAANQARALMIVIVDLARRACRPRDARAPRRRVPRQPSGRDHEADPWGSAAFA